MFTGNRGVIHDPQTRMLLKRRWTTKAWLICVCEFRGRRRDVMGRNAPSGAAGWTELFFLDEVTALAAGHRPCFYCRRQAAADFAGRFGDSFGVTEPKAKEIDARLHGERLASGGNPAFFNRSEVENLPDGAMVSEDEAVYAILRKRILPWSFAGYGAAAEISMLNPRKEIRLVTPPSTLAVLRAGYRPIWHPSAGA